MHIDLNGLPYILNLRWQGSGSELAAEVVDEGFVSGVVRAPVSDIDGIVALIERVSGILPDADTVGEIAGSFDELLRDRDLRTFAEAAETTLPKASGM
ncbi:MAG: hypothetical protein AAGH68_13670 [Pseudomonadota bacterium]